MLVCNKLCSKDDNQNYMSKTEIKKLDLKKGKKKGGGNHIVLLFSFPHDMTTMIHESEV